jgi:hypothetical protein
MGSLTVQETNRQIVARYWEEFWTKGNTAIVDELCSDNVTVFYPLHGQKIGKEAVKQSLISFKLVSVINRDMKTEGC